jgi:hypothetical protein
MNALLWALPLLLPAPAQDRKMEWKKDYAAALREAKERNRYLVVHFTGPG